MKPAIKKQWLEALRSGQYDQTVGEYYRDGAYCALGLLEFLCKDEFAHQVPISGEAFIAVVEWNDIQSLPFPAIADKIEASPLFESTPS